MCLVSFFCLRSIRNIGGFKSEGSIPFAFAYLQFSPFLNLSEDHLSGNEHFGLFWPTHSGSELWF